MSLGTRLALAAWITVTSTSCEATPVCPENVEQAAAGDFSALGENTVVGIGRVIRYVPSPVLESRGYDLSIDRTWNGETPPLGTFLRVANEIPNIRGGQPVIIVAEPGARSIILLQGICVPLIPIGEDDVEP